MAMGCGTSIFVDVSVAQLAKASMISWATRIGAVPGSIPESKLTYNYIFGPTSSHMYPTGQNEVPLEPQRPHKDFGVSHAQIKHS